MHITQFYYNFASKPCQMRKAFSRFKDLCLVPIKLGKQVQKITLEARQTKTVDFVFTGEWQVQL